jgi:hypothetical protein
MRIMLINEVRQYSSTVKISPGGILSKRRRIGIAVGSQLYSLRRDISGELTVSELAKKLARH